ncbi:MAG: hypothetical protein ACE5GB_12480 [Acidimicrobiales bacterium]
MSLPRTAFLVGLGTMLLVIVGLVLLWRTAGGDDPSAAPIAATDQPATSAPSVTTAGDGDAAALEAETSRADAAESRASELEGRVGDLEGQVSELQDRLAAQPVPALPASWLDRTIVATDAQFVSGNDVGIAVVGQFGGYANIDPVTGVITATGQIADGASRVLRTDSAAWATNYEGNEVLRVDPVTNQVVASIAFPSPDGLAKDGGTLIVASFDGGFVGRVDPGLAETTQQVDVGGNATAVLVTEAGRIFAAVFDTGEVVEIDPTTFTVLDRWIVGNGPVGLAPDGDVIWVSNRREGTVVALDLTTGEVGEAVAVGQGPTEVAVAFGAVWVAVTDAGDLVEVDPGTLTVVTRTPLGGAPTGLTVSGGSLWVGVAGDQSVVRVTPR